MFQFLLMRLPVMRLPVVLFAMLALAACHSTSFRARQGRQGNPTMTPAPEATESAAVTMASVIEGKVAIRTLTDELKAFVSHQSLTNSAFAVEYPRLARAYHTLLHVQDVTVSREGKLGAAEERMALELKSHGQPVLTLQFDRGNPKASVTVISDTQSDFPVSEIQFEELSDEVAHPTPGNHSHLATLVLQESSSKDAKKIKSLIVGLEMESPSPKGAF